MVALKLLLMVIFNSVASIPQYGIPTPGMSENAITSGKCYPVTFIYAKGSTDYGNMVKYTSHDER
jgi:hypothetical protein